MFDVHLNVSFFLVSVFKLYYKVISDNIFVGKRNSVACGINFLSQKLMSWNFMETQNKQIPNLTLQYFREVSCSSKLYHKIIDLWIFEKLFKIK